MSSVWYRVYWNTTRHLYQRIAEHKYSAVGKHLKDEHQAKIPDLEKYFLILRKCQGMLDCLMYEMLFIHARKPKLNTQSDSIRAKVFVWTITFSYYCNTTSLLILFCMKLFDTKLEYIIYHMGSVSFVLTGDQI